MINIPINEIIYNISYSSTKLRYNIKCSAVYNDIEICECELYTDKEYTFWTIHYWHVNDGYGKNGIGTKTMRELISHTYNTHGIPEKIEYVWNGENSYVFDWIYKNFDAVCLCPITVQKTHPEDDWMSSRTTNRIEN